MIDTDLVRKKLAVIESCVQELKTLGRPSEIQTDLRELRFEAYTLQIFDPGGPGRRGAYCFG